MPRRTLFLIIALAVVSVFLVFLALSGDKNNIGKQLVPQKPGQTEKKDVKTTTLYFDPAALTITNTSSPSSVDVVFDTGNDEIAGVQLELSFDPKEVTNVRVKTAPDSLFGAGATVLFNEVNLISGRISYAIAISPSQAQVKGRGKIANITFQRAFTSSLPKTQIQFLDKTMVTKLGEDESVLKQTIPLNITFINTFVPPAIQTTTQPTQ